MTPRAAHLIHSFRVLQIKGREHSEPLPFWSETRNEGEQMKTHAYKNRKTLVSVYKQLSWPHQAVDRSTAKGMRGLSAKLYLQLGHSKEIFETLDVQQGQHLTRCFPCFFFSSTTCHPENTAQAYFLSSPVEAFPIVGHSSISQAWSESWQLKQIIEKWPVVGPSLAGSRGRHGVDTELGSKGKVTNGAEKLSSKPISMAAFPPSYKSRQAFNVGRKRKEADTHFIHSFFNGYALHSAKYCYVQTLFWEGIIMGL